MQTPLLTGSKHATLFLQSRAECRQFIAVLYACVAVSLKLSFHFKSTLAQLLTRARACRVPSGVMSEAALAEKR